MEDAAAILIGAYLVVTLLIDVLFARHLVMCLHECSPAVRTMKPWELWLTMIQVPLPTADGLDAFFNS